MTSFLQRVLSLATAAATLSALSGEVNASQVGPEPINTPTLTFPENPQVLVKGLPSSSPTNLTPERHDSIVELSKLNPFSVTRMPRDLSQVAQGDGQTSSQQTQPTTSSAAATKKPPTGVTPNPTTFAELILNSELLLKQGLKESEEKFRNRSPIPGS
jgi:hypothetical protein